MLHSSPFLALASLLCLAPACLLDITDDSAATGSASSGPATESSCGASGSGSNTESGTAADETTTDNGVCGWGPTGDDAVPDGYVCGGDGEDPGGAFPMQCPDEVELQMGGDCGGITGEGCCDTQGNVWFCGDAGRGPALTLLVC